MLYQSGDLPIAPLYLLKQHRNQYKTCQNSDKFHTPKVFEFFEKLALKQCKDKHREKQQFHMLPRGFVNA